MDEKDEGGNTSIKILSKEDNQERTRNVDRQRCAKNGKMNHKNIL